MSLIHGLDNNGNKVPIKISEMGGRGPVTQARNRNLNAASSTYATATNTATWTTAVTDFTIMPQVTTTQGAQQNSQACLVVYGAPNTAVAAAWLADTGSASADVQYDLVYAGTTLARTFSSGINRIDVLPIGTGNTVMRVVIGAN